MIKHLYYKEWLKTRWYVLASVILGLCVTIITFVTLNSQLKQMGASSYLYTFFRYEMRYFDNFHYIPLIIALLIGLSQFAPEVTRNRIKLTLHLPVNNTYVVYLMALYGFCILMVIYTFFALLFLWLDSWFFPASLTIAMFKTITPWMLGGLTAYFFIAMISMEPVLKFKFLYLVVLFGIVNVFYSGGRMAPLENMFGLLMIIVLVASMSLLFSSHRFNKGEL